MTVQDGSLCVLQRDRTLTVRAEGWADWGHGLALRRCVERFLASGAGQVLVDLRSCTHIDSTFLGTLLYLHHSLERRGAGRLTLLSPSAECQQILELAGLTETYLVATEEPTAGDWVPLSCGVDDREGFRRHVVQAHQELADLPGTAGEPFRDVMSCLSQERKSSLQN